MIDLRFAIPELSFCAGMELAAGTEVLLILEWKGEMKIVS
jgi:hypothetical protein